MNTHNERDRSPEEQTVAHPHSHQWINKFNFTQSAMAIIALIVGSLALGAVAMEALNDREQNAERALNDQRLAGLQQELIDAKVQAGAAKAEATAQAAKEHARIALAEVQRANAQLEAKGLISPAQH